MEKTQSLETALLNFLDVVCKKYGFNYWLEAGTLLGAVRHQNFIPWDDDIDIGMMRKDYEKLLPAIKYEIKANNLEDYLSVERMDRVNDNNFLISFIKLSFRIKGSLFGFIDVLPYDYRESDKNIDGKIYKNEKNLFFKKFFDGGNKKQLINEYIENLNLSYEEADYIIPGVDSVISDMFGFKIVKKESIFPLGEIKFNNNYYPCPNNFDEHLRGFYGDYLNIPRVVRNHGLFDLKRKVADECESYDFSIKTINEANENIKKSINKKI